ncbi:MAG: hypothetical protein ACR2RB_17165 [Gammaproteobacteria bacterium]
MRNTLSGILMLVLVLITQAESAQLQVACVEGCLPRVSDQTVDLVFRPDESTPVTIRWSAPQNPAPEGWTVNLYAGNPAMQDTVPDRGQLVFAENSGVWQASYQLGGEELGHGTFLAVTTLKNKSKEQVLDWRAFRLKTKAEEQREQQGPDANSQWSLDVTPVLLQVTSGRGDLPRSRGGDRKVWWSLADTEGDTGDLDIDGVHNGVAGIGVQISTPWHAREDWKQELLNRLTGVDDHSVQFGDLVWNEQPDRELDLGGEIKPVLRNYYTLITLYTTATVKTVAAKEAGGSGSRTYFTHETSARLKHPKDPVFWASYSLREYGADRKLLELLEEYVKESGAVPGLGRIQQDGGDGGSTIYKVGFAARVRPWEGPETDAEQQFRAGFVGLDVIAARAGFGDVVTRGSLGQEGLKGSLCKLISCDAKTNELNLNEPPRGYEVAQPVASLTTVSGNLPMVSGKPLVAQRELPHADAAETEFRVVIPNLPGKTRFGLGANLRAGALIRKGGFLGLRVTNLVPINSYAQFVVKMSVAMLPETPMVTNEEAVLVDPEQFDIKTVLPKARGFLAWLSEHITSAIGMAIIVGVLLLLFLIPGLRQFISAFFRLLAAFLNRLARKVGPAR